MQGKIKYTIYWNKNHTKTNYAYIFSNKLAWTIGINNETLKLIHRKPIRENSEKPFTVRVGKYIFPHVKP